VNEPEARRKIDEPLRAAGVIEAKNAGKLTGLRVDSAQACPSNDWQA